MGASQQDQTVEVLVKKAIGLSFWKSHWGLPTGLMILPIAGTVGVVTGAFALGALSLDRSEVSGAGQMIVGFSSFITAAWTFGFAYFWPNTEQSVRQIRTLILKTKPREANVLDWLSKLRMPFRQFLLAVVGLVLMIWAALLAVTASLFGSVSLVVWSCDILAAGCVLMIGTWVQLFVARDVLGSLSEILSEGTTQ